nr:hypothetical protein [Mycoplasmopsis bovis]
MKVRKKDDIKLRNLGICLEKRTVPTKYIDKNGKEISDDSWDLS